MREERSEREKRSSCPSAGGGPRRPRRDPCGKETQGGRPDRCFICDGSACAGSTRGDRGGNRARRILQQPRLRLRLRRHLGDQGQPRPPAPHASQKCFLQRLLGHPDAQGASEREVEGEERRERKKKEEASSDPRCWRTRGRDPPLPLPPPL